MQRFFVKSLWRRIAVSSMLLCSLFVTRHLYVAPKFKVNTTFPLDAVRIRQDFNTMLNKFDIFMKGESYCKVKSPWVDDVFKHKLTSNLVNWTFTKRWECPVFQIDMIPEQRKQVVLHCESSTPYMTTIKRNFSDKIEQVQFGDQCLIDVLDECCYDENKVPNVAHFVWYKQKELGYFHFLALMSLLRFMRPCLILIHGPSTPYGRYWDWFISQTPNIILVQRERPEIVFGHRLAYKEHASDVMGIQALQAYGGLYIDFDEVLLRSPDPLRKYEYTQGHEESTTLGSQYILAKKNASFLTKWLESYRVNYNKTWGFNAVILPWSIAAQHPELIHVEGYNFTRPNGYHKDLLFKKNYDWSTNYAMHLYIRAYKQPIDINIMRTLNTTVGAVSRHILLGNKEPCIN